MRILFNNKYDDFASEFIDLIGDEQGNTSIEVAYIQVLSGSIQIKGTIHDEEQSQNIGAICLNDMRVVETLEAGKIYIVDTNGLSSITLLPAEDNVDTVSVQVKALA